jgi:hypothetical protein
MSHFLAYYSLARKPGQATACAAAYSIPNPLATDAEWAQWCDLDLPHLDDDALVAELYLVRLALRRPLREHSWLGREWLAGRRTAVLAELRRRRPRSRASGAPSDSSDAFEVAVATGLRRTTS